MLSRFSWAVWVIGDKKQGKQSVRPVDSMLSNITHEKIFYWKRMQHFLVVIRTHYCLGLFRVVDGTFDFPEGIL